MSNYYSDYIAFPYIERAVLMEAVKVPINNSKLTLKYFDPELEEKEGHTEGGDQYSYKYYNFDFTKEYILTMNMLKDITAKFYIPIIMPSISNTEAKDNTNTSPKSTGFKGTSTKSASGYTSSTYINLTIPKYLLYQFLGSSTSNNSKKTTITTNSYITIPKGTEFLIACPGGEFKSDRMRIIGIYTL